MKTKLSMILFVVLVTALSQSAWARQGQWDGPDGHPGKGQGMRMMACDNGQMFPPHLLPMMTVALELKAEQVEKITTLDSALRNTFEAQRDLKSEQRKLMAPPQQGAALDVKALRHDLDALKAQEVDLLVKRVQLREELSQVLTVEQREKCQAMMTSMQPMKPRRGMAPNDSGDRRGCR